MKSQDFRIKLHIINVLQQKLLMSASEIRKYSHLSELELVELKILFDACVEHDHTPPRMYWDAVSRRDSTQYRDFIYFQGNQVIGYLGFFLFGENDIEICAFVDPEFRNQNIFRQLLFHAMEEVDQMAPQKLLFTIPHISVMTPALYWLNKLGAEKIHTEYRMDLDKPFPQEVITRGIVIREATIEDIPELAALDKECFGSDLELMVTRYQSILKENERRTWIAIYEDKIIGKIHAHIEPGQSFIHDFCVLPNYQGKHHGLALLQHAVNYLLEQGHFNVSVYVQVENERALRLYQYANFIIVEAWDTWAWNPQLKKIKQANLH